MSRNRYSMNPYPHNPFQGKGRSAILPRYTAVPQRGASMTRALRQACVVVTVGAVLVTALSWAVPPAPGDVNSMAAPRPLQPASSGGIRIGGGVRSQSRVRNVKKPEDSRHAHPAGGRHHWDADTLEQENHGYDGLADFDAGSDDESQASTNKKKLAAKIESKTKEENAHAADGVFGRKEDAEENPAGNGDEGDKGEATLSEDEGNEGDAELSKGEGNKQHGAPKGHVEVDALDSEDNDVKEAEELNSEAEKGSQALEGKDLSESKPYGDVHRASKDEEKPDKAPVSESADDKKNGHAREEKEDASERAAARSKTNGEDLADASESVGEKIDDASEKANQDEPKEIGNTSGDAAVAKTDEGAHADFHDKEKSENDVDKTTESGEKGEDGGDTRDTPRGKNDAGDIGADNHSNTDEHEVEQSNKKDAISPKNTLPDPAQDRAKPDDGIDSDKGRMDTGRNRDQHQVVLELDGDIEAEVA